MGKKRSLTETAKQILSEGGIPSVSSNMTDPDRDAQAMNSNLATLRPGSRNPEGRFANPGSNPPDSGDMEDLGPALTKMGDIPPSAKAAGKLGKDKSRSSNSPVGGEPFGSVKRSPTATVEEDIEMSEELEAFINEMIDEGYSDEQIADAIAENFDIITEKKHEEEEEEEEEEESSSRRKGKKREEEEEEEEEEEGGCKKMMKEHVDALLAGENLSEDFREKAETIFESAVSIRVNEELRTLEEAYAASLEEEVEGIRNELTEQINSYLNYVVENWIEENEVAIETGLRTEITEDFIAGLKSLFAEHYIDIPEDKVNVIEELGSKVDALENKLNEEIDRNINLNKQLTESKRFEVLAIACDGLTTTQAQKLRSLSENVDFISTEDYARKIETLRESYFPSTITSEKAFDRDTNDHGMITEETTGRMGAYVKALGKTLPV